MEEQVKTVYTKVESIDSKLDEFFKILNTKADKNDLETLRKTLWAAMGGLVVILITFILNHFQLL